MPEQPISPPPDKMVRHIQQPDHTVAFYTELVSRESPRFQALSPIKRGTPYASGIGADQRIVDAHGDSLVFLKEMIPLGGTVNSTPGDLLVLWQWSTDHLADNAASGDISYPYDSVDYPAYGRVTTIKRDDYEANPTVAYGSALTALIAIKVVAGGTGYAPDDVVTISGSHGCAAEIVVDEDGAITNVIITNEGSGLDSASLPTIGVTTTTGSGANLVAIVQPKTAILTSQKKSELPDNDPYSHEFVELTRVYETIPGPYIPFTRWDNDLGPIQGKRRTVLAANQVASVTATAKTTYEARQDSSYVAWELVETNSDGTGSAGNPAYPIYTEQIHNAENVAGTRVTQTVVAAGQTGSTVCTGGNIITTDYLTIDGNPYLLKKVVETFPIFPGNLYEDVSPAYPAENVTGEVTTAVTSCGDASQPTAPAGGKATEQQVDKLEKRVTTTTPSVSTTTTEKETDAKKVVSTNVGVIGGTVGTPSATVDVEQQVLPGGRVRAITKTKAELFDEHEFVAEKPDPVPERFRASVPTETEIIEEAGTSVSLPSLLATEYRKLVKRISKYVKRTETTSRDDGSLPTLSGQTVDETLGIIKPYDESVVASGTTLGTPYTEVTPLSSDLDLSRTTNTTAYFAALDAYMITFPGVVNIQLPAELLSVDGTVEIQGGDGTYSESGSAISVNNGWGLSLHGSGQASAALMPDVVPEIQQRLAERITTTQYMFFMKAPFNVADVLARLPGTTAWPKFMPVAHTFLCVGHRLSLEVKTAAQANEFLTSSSGSSAISSGQGVSREFGLTIKAVRLPPAIHGAISVGGTTSDSLDITADSSTDISGWASASESEMGTVDASITPTSLSATGGASEIPSSGVSLYDLNVELADLGYCRVHAETVDWADV